MSIIVLMFWHCKNCEFCVLLLKDSFLIICFVEMTCEILKVDSPSIWFLFIIDRFMVTKFQWLNNWQGDWIFVEKHNISFSQKVFYISSFKLRINHTTKTEIKQIEVHSCPARTTNTLFCKLQYRCYYLKVLAKLYRVWISWRNFSSFTRMVRFFRPNCGVHISATSRSSMSDFSCWFLPFFYWVSVISFRTERRRGMRSLLSIG